MTTDTPRTWTVMYCGPDIERPQTWKLNARRGCHVLKLDKLTEAQATETAADDALLDAAWTSGFAATRPTPTNNPAVVHLAAAR